MSDLPPPYVGPYGAPPDPKTTPDGQELAGWGRRVAGSVIDSVIVTPIGLALSWPFLRHVVEVYGDYVEDTVESSEHGGPVPSTINLLVDTYPALVAISLIGLVANFLYVVGFLAWRQATIGKLLVGTRVRLRERPGPMPLTVVLRRWVAQYGPSVLGLVPIVGGASGMYSLVDGLFPLWDPHRQSLHDKFAGTNVVRHVRD